MTHCMAALSYINYNNCMETKEVKGEPFAAKIRDEVLAGIADLQIKGITPRLAAVVTDPNPAIMSYAESKKRTAEQLGVTLDLVSLPLGSGQDKLEETLDGLAADPAVHGIMLELPLGRDLDLGKALDHIPPLKDIDGLTARNLGLLAMGREDEALLAATAQACVFIAETIMPLKGVRVGVVGKGRTVGTPLIGMLLNRDATVTVTHIFTTDLAASLRDSKIIFTATGKAGLIDKKIIQKGQVIIDAGISVVDGKVRGDLVMEDARGVAEAFTPVPQGVGPLTTALIFRNLILAIKMQNASKQ